MFGPLLIKYIRTACIAVGRVVWDGSEIGELHWSWGKRSLQSVNIPFHSGITF